MILRYKAALAQEALGTFLRPVGGLAVTRFMRLLYFFGFYERQRWRIKAEEAGSKYNISHQS